MPRIDGSDRVLLQLQEQLQRLSKERQVRRGAAGPPSSPGGTPMQRVRQLAQRGGIGDDELRRTMVRSVLLDQFGDQLGADPAFEAMTTQVLGILQDTEQGRQLIGDAMRHLLPPNRSP